MKRTIVSQEITPSEWLSINQFLYEIKQINSTTVSVYYPHGKGKETISLLKETKRNEQIEKIESKIENRIMASSCVYPSSCFAIECCFPYSSSFPDVASSC